jgi:hypothetical protein
MCACTVCFAGSLAFDEVSPAAALLARLLQHAMPAMPHAKSCSTPVARQSALGALALCKRKQHAVAAWVHACRQVPLERLSSRQGGAKKPSSAPLARCP